MHGISNYQYRHNVMQWLYKWIKSGSVLIAEDLNTCYNNKWEGDTNNNKGVNIYF